MFASNPLDKSCIGPDCSSGRNNASNRFPMGLISLGDENQQIRIQLAVNKYNSSANSPLSNRCAVTSPFRHSFLKNSFKAKNYEGDAEGTSKNNEKRIRNQYDGVGAFPTIHLKKSAVRYRPIRRFNDVKVSYPELPVNRFLSNIPEACPDLKSSTRSVLDVLEDLSGKKIHSKDDSISNKPKSKGLAGDYQVNPNAVYKPLFVQKPKISSVLTRDNTTQTLSSFGMETPSPQISNLSNRNDSYDPRAELRRKLAKKNNEIFASLSSSVSSFSLKRKIDKVLPTTADENLSDESVTKKSKAADHQTNNYRVNGISKSASRFNISSCDSIRNKSKLRETNSPTSPNKDRLTAIFLDMQNTSPKALMFEKNSALMNDQPSNKDTHPVVDLSNGFTHTTNGFGSKPSSPILNDSTGTETIDTSKDKTYNNSNSGFHFVEKPTSPDTNKPETEHPSKPVFNFPIGKAATATSDITKSPSETFQIGMNANTSNFNFLKTSTESSATEILGNGSTMEKKEGENQVLNKTVTFENSADKPDFNSFKFGTNGSIPPQALNVPPKDIPISPKDDKIQNSEAPPLSTIVTPPVTPQFSFGKKTSPGATTSSSQPFTVQFSNAAVQNTTIIPAKSLFSFGQNATSNQGNSNNAETGDKSKSSNGSSTTTSTTISGLESSTFSFGQKTVAESAFKAVNSQNAASAMGPTTQANTLTFSSPSATGLITSTGFALQTTKSLFTFGQKSETFTTATSSVTTAQEQKLPFTFGQKLDADQNKIQGESGQRTTNLFSFGQKLTESQDSKVPTASANLTSTSQATTTQSDSLFGQNVSQVTATPQSKFPQISTTQTSNGFGAKSEGQSLISVTAPTPSQINSAFPIKTPLFGASTSAFGTTTSQAPMGFGTSTSTASSFGFPVSATTLSTTTYGVSSTPTSTPALGSSSNAQYGFGGSAVTRPTPTFGSLVSNSAPTFGVSTALQSLPVCTTQSVSTFGSTSTTQSIPSFGTPNSSLFGVTSTTQSASAFGGSSASQSTPTFGTSSTTQATPAFGTTSGFGVSASSQSNTVFAAPNSTQSAVRFGAQESNTFGPSTGFSATTSTHPNTNSGVPAPTSTSAFGASQPSFSQPFDNKATSTSRPTTNIFGQNPTPDFPSGSTFTSNQNSVFGQKSNADGGMFDRNKIPTPAFGTTPQTFGAQNKFSFGSTSNPTGFTNSTPNATSAPVFGFGSANTTGTFTFGTGTSAASNTQKPFSFKSPTNESFQFGATASTKEGPGFGGGSSTFTFGSQMNNNAISEQKNSFNFGSTQVSSSAPFAFGTTSSPSVFSFGSSTPASSNSTFNFGTPTPGGHFGQTPTPTPTPGAPFAVPGTFSIGSGSSQSRPRVTARPRRRP